ncbi:MAG: alpha/beta fold hydrolase [Flavobacteriaceae bacterium]|nr:alpha/beta fold hydrolase [Flavobacteriaceae bacterium]
MLLHARILGEGTPLLILHGYFGMGDNWKSIGAKLSDRFQVHLIDQRNHGRSFHADDFDYEILVEDLYAYIQYHQLEKVVILGHSMGGKVAMLFAVTYPEMVSKLIVADISPRFYSPHHQQILEALKTVDFTVQRSRKEVEDVLSESIEEAGVRQFLLKNVYWKEKGQLAYRFNLESLTVNSDEVGMALPSFTDYNGPTLFLKGEKSGYISASDTALIRAHFPKSEIKTVKNAGHWLHAENPTAFYDYLSAFLY